MLRKLARTVRRVPENLDIRPGQVWEPSRLPLALRPAECLDCPVDHPGRNSDYAWLHALLEVAHVVSVTDAYRHMPASVASIPHTPHAAPGPDLKDLITGLTGPHFEDAFPARAVEALIDKAGLNAETWGTCPSCNGTGHIDAYPGQADDRASHTYPEPPEGDAWQLWTSTTPLTALTYPYSTSEGLTQALIDTGELDGTRYTMRVAVMLVSRRTMRNGLVSAGRVVAYGD